MQQAQSITAARLRHLLSYDPDTGAFVWVRPSSVRVRVVDVAGTVRNRYVRIRIDNTSYLAHRLAWLYMTGEWPIDQIDHVNRDKQDNRWANLRQASASQNGANCDKRARNTSGHKGVTWHRRNARWQVYVGRTYVGQFDHVEDAAEAYARTAAQHYGTYAQA